MADLKFTIAKNSLALVIDRDDKRTIGTAFVFLQPHWVVTAKHVVLQEDGTARSIELQFLDTNLPANPPATLLYAHPTVDLAVLSVPGSPCKSPLFPAHHALAGLDGLVVAGYAPSLTSGISRSIFVNYVPSFETELRERVDGNEEVVVFQSNFTEPGHSGGPVFGAGGGVAGVVIERSETGRSRATSLAPLLQQLRFPSSQSVA